MWVLILLIVWVTVSIPLLFLGYNRCEIGDDFIGNTLISIGLISILLAVCFAWWKEDELKNVENELNNVGKSTWENRETFFWEDVDKGKIIEEWQTAQCSECGRWLTTPYLYSFTEYEYCPHCGSPMKSDEVRWSPMKTGGKEK